MAEAYLAAREAAGIHSMLHEDPTPERDDQVRQLLLKHVLGLEGQADRVADLVDQVQRLNRQLELHRVLMDLWLRVRRADIAGMFAEPVSPEFDGYYTHIKTPMDLATMGQRLMVYPTITAFEQDLALIIDNCLKFNGPRSFLGEYAIETAREWHRVVRAARAV